MIESVDHSIPVLNLLGSPNSVFCEAVNIVQLAAADKFRWKFINAPPRKTTQKRQFSKISILKMHPWVVGVLLFQRGQHKLVQNHGEKLLHVEVCLLIYFSAEGCPSSGLAAVTLLAEKCLKKSVQKVSQKRVSKSVNKCPSSGVAAVTLLAKKCLKKVSQKVSQKSDPKKCKKGVHRLVWLLSHYQLKILPK